MVRKREREGEMVWLERGGREGVVRERGERGVG